MRYQCRDCSYRGRAFPEGACPACDSRDIERLGAHSEAVQRRQPYSLILCMALWLWLAYEIYQRLQ